MSESQERVWFTEEMKREAQLRQKQQPKEFVAQMLAIQDDRAEAVGGHSWEKLVERYGPQAMFFEMASILSRLEVSLLSPGPIDRERVMDLCLDMGNYASFLWSAIEQS